MRLVFLLLFMASCLSAQQRYALVIGNADYPNAGLGVTPVNDANAMRDALATCGFEVDFYTNLDQIKLNTAISNFVRKVKSHRGAALFYYSGHGVQHNNQNYLVPIGSELTDEYDVAGLCIPINRITAMLTGAGTSPNILVLDACRAFPLQREDKNLNQGLANENYIGSELLVAYATAPGNTATLRGENGMSLYTSQLIKHLKTPGLRIEDVLKNTRRDVLQKSSGQQRPDETGSLVSDFYFTPAIATDTRPPVVEKELPQTQPVTPEVSTRSGSPDADLDGTPDATDACPNDYGPISSRGCPDYDEDGVPNTSDKCPNIPGKKAWQGCPDSDSDGLPDHEDDCPTLWGTSANKGCPPADRDKDGTPDDNDVCPDQFGPKLLSGCPDTDSDGVADKSDKCPDKSGLPKYQGCPDTDGDGVPDHEDMCPNLKGSTDKSGCPNDGFEMVLIEGGTFEMGCTSEQKDCKDDEKPVHKVTVNSFSMGKYEVTQAQWQSIMGSNPSYFQNCDQCPVENVSWDDVQVFLKKLNEKYPGRNYRLPTEAEWEYAARERGKTMRLFGNGETKIDPLEVNFNASNNYKTRYSIAGLFRQKTVSVGSFEPNTLGLFDMSGNVSEWCQDWYNENYYQKSIQSNPTGPAMGSFRVQRGGSWHDYPQFCRTSTRSSSVPGDRSVLIGFRLCRTQ